jgi:hypothetical protein
MGCLTGNLQLSGPATGIFGTIPPRSPYTSHMRTWWTLLLSLILTASLSWASDLALTGAKVYPSPADPPIENGSVLIHDGHIVAVGPGSTIKIPSAARVIDCKGLVVTAGFWNSHVHILPPTLLHARDSGAKELDRQLETMFNRWGFTTVFDITSVLDNTLALRRRIDASELRGRAFSRSESQFGQLNRCTFVTFSSKTISRCRVPKLRSRGLLWCAITLLKARTESSYLLFPIREQQRVQCCRWRSPRLPLTRPIVTACPFLRILRRWKG